MSDSRATMLRDVEAALVELSSHVRVSLAKLNGPLRNALRDLLHDPVNLPDATCYDLAADAIDVLHEAQQLIEPRASILADHFLGMLVLLVPKLESVFTSYSC